VFTIQFSESAREQVRRLTADQRTRVLTAIEEQLSHQPFEKTRNRKPLRANPFAPWELRVGRYRVFYGASADDSTVVEVLAVGEKIGNAVVIDGKEVKL
jgi:mRNA-degrading endonuclease RelE of RelBE toxin-antitoxin system